MVEPKWKEPKKLSLLELVDGIEKGYKILNQLEIDSIKSGGKLTPEIALKEAAHEKVAKRVSEYEKELHRKLKRHGSKVKEKWGKANMFQLDKRLHEIEKAIDARKSSPKEEVEGEILMRLFHARAERKANLIIQLLPVWMAKQPLSKVKTSIEKVKKELNVLEKKAKIEAGIPKKPAEITRYIRSVDLPMKIKQVRLEMLENVEQALKIRKRAEKKTKLIKARRRRKH